MTKEKRLIIEQIKEVCVLGNSDETILVELYKLLKSARMGRDINAYDYAGRILKRILDKIGRE